MKAAMKTETIDETCRRPTGSFKKFVEKKEAHLRTLELQRKARQNSPAVPPYDPELIEFLEELVDDVEDQPTASLAPPTSQTPCQSTHGTQGKSR